MEEWPYVRLRYMVTDSEGNSTEYDYKVHLNSTSCHFGGLRWWFACRDCGRRAAILYLPYWARLFRCRHCYDLTYRSRTANRRGTFGLLGHYSRRRDQLAEQESNLKRHFYKGRPTKRYRRILDQIDRLDGRCSSAGSFQLDR